MRGWWPAAALVAAALGWAWFDGDSGLRTRWGLRSDLQEANARIEELRRDVETRREDATSLQADEFAIERAIRERLEYARPGETIVRLRAGSGATNRIP